MAEVVANVAAATPEPHLLLFVASASDGPELAALDAADAEALIVGWAPGRGDYARKINAGIAATVEPLCFLGADDLRWHDGWLTRARERLASGVEVVGTNDLLNPRVLAGEHATHSLVTRRYVVEEGTIDEPGKALHEGYGHEYCNPPDAPIWMADLTFRPLGEVRVGDEVVGWERFTPPGAKNSLNRLCVATVTRVMVREAPLVKVTMESGRTLRCTPDHRWHNPLWMPSNAARWPTWPQSVIPGVGHVLLHVADVPSPVPADLERLAGWLGGIYDGEGSWIEIAQCPVANPEVYAAICAAMNKLDIPYAIGARTNSHHLTLLGGRQGYLNFLLRCQPVKRASIVGKIIGGRRFGHRDVVASVEPDGGGDVFAMTTTTGNYVAWGYASKNCDDEFCETARARGRFVSAPDSIVEHLHPYAHKATVDATYRRGWRHRAAGRALYLRRRPLWHPS